MKIMLKYLLIVMLANFSFGSIAAQKTYKVRVRLSNNNNYPMFLIYKKDGGGSNIDSIYTTENGYKVFRGSVDDIILAHLVVTNSKLNISLEDKNVLPGPLPSFYLENGTTVTIDANADKPVLANIISTGKEGKIYERYRSKDKLLEDSLWTLMKTAFRGDSQDTAIDKKIDILEAKRREWHTKFIKENSQSLTAFDLFSSTYKDMNYEEGQRQLKMFSEAARNSVNGKKITRYFEGIAATVNGKKATTFTQAGYQGKMVDIAALKGKVILIDFWGSWCGPCRASHPHLKEIYNEYKDKGFEIVGIAAESGSKEKQMAAWEKAITEDGITWLQVLNDPAVNDLVSKYGISAFPTKILVDREGNIVDRSVGSGEEFDAKLKELLK